MDDTKTLYSEVRSGVVNGRYPPGNRLRAEVLGPEYGCSASTMREVLLRLSSVGLVEFQEQRGFRMPSLSDNLQHDLTKMRIMLECEGACLSVRLGGLEWEARLIAACHKLTHIETHISRGRANSADLQLWTTAELEFHRTLIDACESPLLLHFHDVVYHQFRQQLISRDQEFTFLSENTEQHDQILKAALAHDEAVLKQSISEHLSRNLIAPETKEDAIG